MILIDEDALICDLAETYHIFNYRNYPARLIATLAAGLRDDSRIRRKIAGIGATFSELLLAAAVDRLSLLVWTKTKDAEKGRNRPASVVENLLPKAKRDSGNVVSFSSADDFENARKRIIGG